jgi:hypothetical protein
MGSNVDRVVGEASVFAENFADAGLRLSPHRIVNISFIVERRSQPATGRPI